MITFKESNTTCLTAYDHIKNEMKCAKPDLNKVVDDIRYLSNTYRDKISCAIGLLENVQNLKNSSQGLRNQISRECMKLSFSADSLETRNKIDDLIDKYFTNFEPKQINSVWIVWNNTPSFQRNEHIFKQLFNLKTEESPDLKTPAFSSPAEYKFDFQNNMPTQSMLNNLKESSSEKTPLSKAYKNIPVEFYSAYKEHIQRLFDITPKAEHQALSDYFIGKKQDFVFWDRFEKCVKKICNIKSNTVYVAMLASELSLPLTYSFASSISFASKRSSFFDSIDHEQFLKLYEQIVQDAGDRKSEFETYLSKILDKYSLQENCSGNQNITILLTLSYIPPDERIFTMKQVWSRRLKAVSIPFLFAYGSLAVTVDWFKICASIIPSNFSHTESHDFELFQAIFTLEKEQRRSVLKYAAPLINRVPSQFRKTIFLAMQAVPETHKEHASLRLKQFFPEKKIFPIPDDAFIYSLFAVAVSGLKSIQSGKICFYSLFKLISEEKKKMSYANALYFSLSFASYFPQSLELAIELWKQKTNNDQDLELIPDFLQLLKNLLDLNEESILLIGKNIHILHKSNLEWMRVMIGLLSALAPEEIDVFFISLDHYINENQIKELNIKDHVPEILLHKFLDKKYDDIFHFLIKICSEDCLNKIARVKIFKILINLFIDDRKKIEFLGKINSQSSIPVFDHVRILNCFSIEEIEEAVTILKNNDNLSEILDALNFISPSQRMESLRKLNRDSETDDIYSMLHHLWTSSDIAQGSREYLYKKLHDFLYKNYKNPQFGTFLSWDILGIAGNSETNNPSVFDTGENLRSTVRFLAQRIFYITTTTSDPKNPYRIHKAISEFTKIPLKMDLSWTVTDDKSSTDGDDKIKFIANAAWNFEESKKAALISYTKNDICELLKETDRTINPNIFDTLLKELETRIQDLPQSDKDIINGYITWISFDSMHSTVSLRNAMNKAETKGSLNHWLIPIEKMSEKIDHCVFYLYSIVIKFILSKDNKYLNEWKLTEQEQALINFCNSMTECRTGQQDSISEFYNNSLCTPQSQTSKGEMYDKISSYVLRVFQNPINQVFDSKLFLIDILNKKNLKEFGEDPHLVLFLNNAFSKLGKSHRYTFDSYAEIVPSSLLDFVTKKDNSNEYKRDVKEFVDVFNKHLLLTIKKNFSELKQALNTALATGKIPKDGLIDFFKGILPLNVTSQNNYGWWANYIYSENFKPQEITDGGILAILEHFGYFKVEFNQEIYRKKINEIRALVDIDPLTEGENAANNKKRFLEEAREEEEIKRQKIEAPEPKTDASEPMESESETKEMSTSLIIKKME